MAMTAYQEIKDSLRRLYPEDDRPSFGGKSLAPPALGSPSVLLKPPSEQSFWINIIEHGYPPPNRPESFRDTQRLTELGLN